MQRHYQPSRTDTNQQTIMDSLRKLGYSVVSLHSVGNGVFDLLAAKHGLNWLVEVKDGLKPPSARELTQKQVSFHFSWQGARCVVTCGADVMRFHNCATRIIKAVHAADIDLSVVGNTELQYQPRLYA